MLYHTCVDCVQCFCAAAPPAAASPRAAWSLGIDYKCVYICSCHARRRASAPTVWTRWLEQLFGYGVCICVLIIRWGTSKIRWGALDAIWGALLGPSESSVSATEFISGVLPPDRRPPLFPRGGGGGPRYHVVESKQIIRQAVRKRKRRERERERRKRSEEFFNRQLSTSPCAPLLLPESPVRAVGCRNSIPFP